MTFDHQRGSATVFGVTVMGMIVTVGLALVAVLGAVSYRIQTETAADAAALAAVAAAVDGRDPQLSAARMAVANGAELVACRCPDFTGGAFTATVLVSRDVRIPMLGARRIEIEGSAGFVIDP